SVRLLRAPLQAATPADLGCNADSDVEYSKHHMASSAVSPYFAAPLRWAGFRLMPMPRISRLHLPPVDSGKESLGKRLCRLREMAIRFARALDHSTDALLQP